MFRALARYACRFVLIATAFCCSLPAQEGSGQIVGTVTDASHAYVPGATVSLVHAATGVTRSTLSDSYGGFLFAGLPIGDYEVTVKLTGFATVRHTGVTVAVGLPTRLDVELQPSAVPQEVTVQGGVELLNTQSAEGGR